MWFKRFTHYLLQHRYVTIALTFLITFVPVVGSFGILIAALVTLRKGIVEGAILTLAATVPYAVSFYLSGSHDVHAVPLMVWAAVGAAAVINVLTWVFAAMLRRHSSWSTILQVGALLGVLTVSVIHLVYPDVTEWWVKQMTAQAQAVAGSLKDTSTAVADTQAQAEAIKMGSEHATGVVTSVVLFFAFLQLIVARWWDSLVFHAGNLRRELHGIRLSHLAGVLFVVSLVLAYYGNNVVLDIMPILYLLFGAAGLSLIHFMFKLMNSPTAWFWLLVIYLILVFAMPTSFLLLAMLGLVDIWLDARKRFKTV